ncbi:hypothetical protein JCM8097_005360 [Rhodosporidiobolus ruineniae]
MADHTTSPSSSRSIPPPTPFYTALLAGALAGTSVDTLFFPIDTLKTRLQSQQGFVAAGGFKGVYRGLGSAVVGSAPGASFFFTTYETLKGVLPRAVPKLAEEGMQPVVHMISASGGEVAACLIRVPTEVVKQRSQTSASSSSLEVFRAVLRQEGLGGFYRGFGTTVAREIPFSLLQFPLYERLKLLLSHYYQHPSALQHNSSSDLSALEAAACGSFAGGVAAGLTTPLDVCKTRIMLSQGARAAEKAKAVEGAAPTAAGPAAAAAEVAAGTPVRSLPSILPPFLQLAPDQFSTAQPRRTHYPNSLPATLRLILAEEGPKALFKGVVPRVLWISGGGAVFLGVYEKGKKILSAGGAAEAGEQGDGRVV